MMIFVYLQKNLAFKEKCDFFYLIIIINITFFFFFDGLGNFFTYCIIIDQAYANRIMTCIGSLTSMRFIHLDLL